MTQEEALSTLKTGVNVYLTGSAGSGKTFVLNAYKAYLQEHGIGVAVTASTGIAATHLGGSTIHAWSGIGIKDRLTPYDIDALEHRKPLWERFQNTKVLIIDEISMLDARVLDMVDYVSQVFKRDSRPFGGMQLVVCGDFFQLPPVTRGGDRPSFAFESKAWSSGKIAVCYLSTQYRQKDSVYTSILEEIRSNSVSEETMEHFRSRYNAPITLDVEPTKLYTHNADVESVNLERLSRIEGKEYSYTMLSSGKKHVVEGLKKSCLAPETLILKEGAVVMCVKNDPEQKYVNGTLGTIVGFERKEGVDMPVVKTARGTHIRPTFVRWSVEEEGKVHGEIVQLPLRLAWAITVHKSQGMSMDAAEVDLSKSFVSGQGYVALSRIRSLDGLTLKGLNSQALSVDPGILLKDGEFRKQSEEVGQEIARLTEKELTALHQDFILRSGGSLKSIPKSSKAESPKRISYQKQKSLDTYRQTELLIEEGLPLSKIARTRDLKERTILDHIDTIARRNKDIHLQYLTDGINAEPIRASFALHGTDKLQPVFADLKGSVSYQDIQLVRACIVQESISS